MIDGEPRIRAARPTERAAVQRLAERAFAEFGEYAEPVAGWLRDPRVQSLVARGGGGVVGFACVAPVQRDGAVVAYLLGIAVEDGERRGGLGHALLGAAIEEARRRRKRWGVERLELEVAPGNLAARRLFAGAGFTELGPGQEYGPGRPSVRMGRDLADDPGLQRDNDPRRSDTLGPC